MQNYNSASFWLPFIFGFSECQWLISCDRKKASLPAEFLLSADNAADKTLSACQWIKLRNAWGHPVSVTCLKLPICIVAHYISHLEKCAK